MIKTTYICDKCKNEMPAPNDESSLGCYGDLFSVKIVPYGNEQHFNPHICKYCIVDLIVKELDDRTRETRDPGAIAPSKPRDLSKDVRGKTLTGASIDFKG